MRHRKIAFFWTVELIIIILIILLSWAKEVGAGEVGDLICSSEKDQQAPKIAFADMNSYLIVWQDFRSGTSYDIYGAGSYEGATINPFPICTVPRDQKRPKVAWNGTHYIVIWEDNRAGSFYDIYAVRIAKSGALMDGPANSCGKSISTALKDQIHPDLVWNGKDYFLVVWEDYRNGESDIYGTRVDKDLVVYDGPPEDGGLVFCQKVGDQKSPSVAWNGYHFLVVWEDHVSAEATDIRGLRVSSVGNILDDVWEGGIAISQEHDIQRNPDVASDGEGFLVIWDNHTTEHFYPDIYGIMISNNGQIYQDEPVPISTAVYNQVNPAVFWTENNYVCLWKDDRDGTVDVYWTRVNRMGELLNGEPEDGGIAFGLEKATSIFTPPGGGFFQAKGMVVWEENYTGQLDIYAIHLIPPVPPMLGWTSETGFESDGAEPDTGYGGESFTFRVLYKDSEGTAPNIAQVWIDLDGDGVFTFPDDDKVDMTIAPEEIEPDHSQGVIYQGQKILNYTGDNGILYRFYFKDNMDEATGPPTETSTVFVENNLPFLSWCEKEGYYTDGIDPDQAEGSYTFVFRVNYQDIEGDLPEVAEVWVDMDDSGTYEQMERFVMLEENQDEIFNGRNYKKNIKILYVGDGKINYRFLFTDGYHLAVGDPNQGDPTKNQTLTVLPHLMAPILSWPIEEGFQDGVKKEPNAGENMCTFKVGYRDPDNDPPITKQVWLDLNGDGVFKEDERFNLSHDGVQDGDFTKVNYYILEKAVSYLGEGEMVYKFVFDDGCNIATGAPFLVGGTIMVQSPIRLEWCSMEGFETDGVEPDAGTLGIAFEFRVRYINQYGYPPSVKEVWLDEDLDGEFNADEKYVMDDANSTDINYTDGKEYFKVIEYTGDKVGFIPYRFVFSDIYLAAIGPPAQEGLEFQIINNDDPQIGEDGQSGAPVWDQLAWEGVEVEGASCFIQSLGHDIAFVLKPGNKLDDMHKRSGASLINLWFTIFKFSLLILLIMAMICFVMFGYSLLKGGWSIAKRL